MGRRSGRKYAASKPGAVFAQQVSTKSEASTPPPGIICMPTLEQMWVESAIAILARLKRPPGTEMMPNSGAASIAEKRNSAIQQLLRLKHFRWLLFVDADMVPGPDMLVELWSTGEDVVSALCFHRRPPYLASAGWSVTKGDEERLVPLQLGDVTGGLVETDLVGGAALLVRRKVFEEVEGPWFQHPEDSPGTKEDTYFCRKVREAGFSVMVHTGLVPGHMSSQPVDFDFILSMQGSDYAERAKDALVDDGTFSYIGDQ